MDTNNLSNLMKTIPEDIIREIIMPFTYRPQPKELLVDIRSFYTDWNVVDNGYILYYNYKILRNDLNNFCSSISHSSYIFYDMDMFKGYNYDYQSLIIKYKKENNIDKIRPLIYRMMVDFIWRCDRPKKRNAWFLFGLLTPAERTEFINKFVIVDDEDEAEPEETQ